MNDVTVLMNRDLQTDFTFNHNVPIVNFTRFASFSAFEHFSWNFFPFLYRKQMIGKQKNLLTIEGEREKLYVFLSYHQNKKGTYQICIIIQAGTRTNLGEKKYNTFNTITGGNSSLNNK